MVTVFLQHSHCSSVKMMAQKRLHWSQKWTCQKISERMMEMMAHEIILVLMVRIYLPMLMIVDFMSLFLPILQIYHRLLPTTLHRPIRRRLMHSKQLLVKIQNFSQTHLVTHHFNSRHCRLMIAMHGSIIHEDSHLHELDLAHESSRYLSIRAL